MLCSDSEQYNIIDFSNCDAQEQSNAEFFCAA